MSVTLMSTVFNADIKDLTYFEEDEPAEFARKAKASTVKLVLLAYADHANDEGEGSYPSLTRLERKTALSRQGVIDTLEALKQNDYISFEGVSKKGTNSYCLNRELLESLVTPIDFSRKVVKSLDQQGSSHLTTPVKPLDPNHPIHPVHPKAGKPAVNLGIQNKIAAGLEVTEEDLKAERHKEMMDAANIIGMNVGGINMGLARNLALAFMEARDIVIAKSKLKGQTKAARELIEANITPDHVRAAVKKMLADNLTCVDLYSVYRPAVEVANKPAEQKPVIVRAPAQTDKKPVPDWVLQRAQEARERLERMAGSDTQTA